ncbi:hypothetical protein NSP_46770 [Nodularia spumigena CCY9414]|nr:hypothetical protein NSP_46770 [Nodularia spumigena CCY9414]
MIVGDDTCRRLWDCAVQSTEDELLAAAPHNCNLHSNYDL